MKWINVKERLPDKGKRVLVLRKDKMVMVCELCNEMGSCDDWHIMDTFCYCPTGYPPEDITHWAELPNLPEE
jgi:Protein of unknown function (DUF551)